MKSSEHAPLSHIDESGGIRMVDVSEKNVTRRTAVASAVITMPPEVLDKLLAGQLKKGQALTTAKIAGINAAKCTSQLIPLCHPLPICWIDITFNPLGDGRLKILATARTSARTGIEMEALTAASVAGLAIYDMAKASGGSIVMGPVQLESKSGGRGGEYHRKA